MKQTVTLIFSLDELRELTGICSEHGMHLKMQAIKNGNAKQFDKIVAKDYDFSSRFYRALIEAEYSNAKKDK